MGFLIWDKDSMSHSWLASREIEKIKIIRKVLKPRFGYRQIINNNFPNYNLLIKYSHKDS